MKKQNLDPAKHTNTTFANRLQGSRTGFLSSSNNSVFASSSEEPLNKIADFLTAFKKLNLSSESVFGKAIDKQKSHWQQKPNMEWRMLSSKVFNELYIAFLGDAEMVAAINKNIITWKEKSYRRFDLLQILARAKKEIEQRARKAEEYSSDYSS